MGWLSEQSKIAFSISLDIIETINQAISFNKTQDIVSPIAVMINLLNVKGGKIFIDRFGRSGEAIQEQHLLLPDFLFEPQSETQIDKHLRPVFDLIWNACDYEKCENFDSAGSWNPPAR